MLDIVLKNCTIVNENQIFESDIGIKGQRIEKIATSISDEAKKTLDLSGKTVIPGVIDDQVHFREPGLTHKGEIATESKAALAGGITSYFEMPNVNPTTTTNELLDKKFDLAKTKSCANFSFYLGASNSNIEEIKKINTDKACGLKVFMGASTGDMLVDNEKTLEDVENELFQEATHSMNLTQSRSRRVVFSLTCHLQNYQYLDNTLECLIKFDVDRIYLNVNLDTYHRIKNKPLNSKVSLNPCRNWGPILKLLPTIQLESDPNTIIILVEVGYIYPPNMVSHMINLYEPYFKRGIKPSAYSATLYKLKSVSYFQKVIVHNNVGDVYESHEGTVFLRSFFRSDFTSYISHLIKDEACRYSEDLMISNYLYKYKIPIKCCLRKWYHSNLVFPYLKKTRLYMNSGIHFPIIYKFHKSVEYMSQHKMLYLRNSYAILESLRSLVKRPSHIPFS